AYMQGVAGRLKIPQGQAHAIVKVGSVPAVIVEEAEGVQDTLIAMCTHGASGADRFLLGSVATKVLHTTKVPLLLFRPGEADPAAMAASLKTIVVPLDGSKLAEQALPHAELLATAFGLGMLLVRATPTLAEFYGPFGYEAYIPAGLFEDMEKEALGYLSAKADEVKNRGLAHASTKHLHGRAASSILDLVHDTPGCLVVITTHGRSGVGRWVLGSVADRLVSHSNAPVLVVRPSGA
ncbi:MAG: universal stress protein, partial [Dehalococcoidia bacterium]|nr:universal stress protein [Dehalococcoidia bacterium]